ncbi:MAG: hypothetical protein ACRDJC_20590 [Thermomicrobiales bacterium]
MGIETTLAPAPPEDLMGKHPFADAVHAGAQVTTAPAPVRARQQQAIIRNGENPLAPPCAKA